MKRVIDNPAAGGWELDDTNGRWEWTGAGTSDGSDDGGGWEFIETISGTDVSAFEFDLDTSSYSSFRFVADLVRSTQGQFFCRLKSNGSPIDTNDYQYENFTVSSSGSITLAPAYNATNFVLQGSGNLRSLLTEGTLSGFANGNVTIVWQSTSERDINEQERVTVGTGGGVCKTPLDVDGALFIINNGVGSGSISLMGLKRD